MAGQTKTKKQLIEELAEAKRKIAELEALDAELSRTVTALKETEARFRAMFDGAAIGMTLTGLDHRPMEANEAFQKMLGYTTTELRSKQVADITHPDDFWMERACLNELLEGKKEHAHYEKRFFRQDGRVVWVSMALSLLRDAKGVPQYSLVMAEDITLRKQAEEQIQGYQEQLRSLAAELSSAKERERRRIATDLHDRITQTLSLSMMKLEVLRESAASSHLAESVEEIRELIQEVIQEARTMILDLSPPVLQDLGLKAALEWLADRMRERHDLVIEVRDEGLLKPSGNDVRRFLFRAVQELLTNVARHARTNRATVTMQGNDQEMTITVEDDGVGFQNPPNGPQMDLAGRFGLFSIRERIRHLGGRLEVVSQPQFGTRATLTVPRKKGAASG
ncbi:MAG: PAS domain S-box protein [Deltaproteobacteria bacterium]|nr:PAS domain S-box protein [Deltaproteobacteria bacterium]